MTTTKFFEQSISPCSSGFGEYQADPINGDAYTDEDCLRNDMSQGAADQGGALYELNGSELPDGVEDIRGRIHNEPARVFAIVLDDGSVYYTGIVERAA